MDISKFKTSDWLKIGGAIGILIFGFLEWVTVEVRGVSFGGGGNVFDFFFTGTLPWLLVIATGVVTFLLVQGMMKAGTLPWPLIFLGATGLAAVLLLIRLIFNPLGGVDDFGGEVEVGRGIGMILSVLSGLAAFAGAFLGFKESGGDLNDLKDMNKLKSSFNQGPGAGSPPPPPPPFGGSTPPPPPPPPAP